MKGKFRLVAAVIGVVSLLVAWYGSRHYFANRRVLFRLDGFKLVASDTMPEEFKKRLRESFDRYASTVVISQGKNRWPAVPLKVFSGTAVFSKPEQKTVFEVRVGSVYERLTTSGR